MNIQKQNHAPARRTLLRSLVSLFALSAALCTSLTAQTQTLTVDANTVVRNVPAGLGGVCAASEFWNTLTPNYRNDLMKARIGLVRIVGYPADSASVGTVEALDRKVAQIINMGATPLFIQCIEAETNTTFKNALLRLDGTLYPDGDTTPINQRVATNITYLVSRYRSAPFNLTTQYWEIGNEPDLTTVNYGVPTTQEYNDFFSLAHNRLVASGVRDNVLLAGPVTSFEYGFGNGSDGYRIRDDIMNDFLAVCGNEVDIVTRHVYGLIYSWEGVTNTPYNQLNSGTEMIHFDHTIGTSRGEKALLARMGTAGVPTSVGTGITELNLFNDGVQIYHNTITQGLWFLLADHYTLYNPRSYVTNGFQLDRNNHFLAYYQNNLPSYPYWAAYVHGVLTGDQILAKTSSNSHLVVTGSKDANYIYVQVLNRHDTASYTANVTINNASVVGTPEEFTLSATENTLLAGVPASGLGTTFTRTFAPMTAKIFRFQRADAPTPPTPPAPPATTVLSTSFDSVPAGMQTYSAVFTPVVASSRLQLTSNVANMRAAVVFNGQPLPASRNRAQIRFGFQVVHNYAEGFVFGAYSASPGAVGDAGQALGYYGQANRLWGVKIDNSPDQIGVVGSTTNALVDGWATQAITSYAATDMFMVIDYDGVAGTVRARMYQGLDDTGTLRADVTNRVGNPATLPAGTVFGFTGATSAWSQTTYIYDLAIRADNGTGGNFVVGQEVIVDNPAATLTGTWVNSTSTGGYYGANYSHENNTNKGGCSATYTPTLTGTGSRDVYVRYTSGTNRATNAPYTVNHAGGSVTIPQNQRTGGGAWVRIGTWTFNHGTSGSVVLGNTATDGFVIADAVRFVNVATP